MIVLFGKSIQVDGINVENLQICAAGWCRDLRARSWFVSVGFEFSIAARHIADIDGGGIVDVDFATGHSLYLLIGLTEDRKDCILIDCHTPFGLSFFIGDFDSIKKEFREKMMRTVALQSPHRPCP